MESLDPLERSNHFVKLNEKKNEKISTRHKQTVIFKKTKGRRSNFELSI